MTNVVALLIKVLIRNMAVHCGALQTSGGNRSAAMAIAKACSADMLFISDATAN